jgi:hypothetical protein
VNFFRQEEGEFSIEQKPVAENEVTFSDDYSSLVYEGRISGPAKKVSE